MKVDWMMLANHAETQGNGLLYISGGGWDTINVTAPLEGEGIPEGLIAAMSGFMVIRLLFHITEVDREHQAELRIMDEDGADVAKADIGINVPRNHDVPPNWLQHMNVVLPVTGIGLKREGLYTINLTVAGQWLGGLSFRVVKAY